ncbi:MAG TPA: hypothetical protein VGA03_02085 [Anaerolineales bacterium]
MKDARGSWYLLTGLVLGLAFGLVFAWVISPRAYGDTSPAFLRADFKDRYRAMIAVSFAANGNLPRAQARLNLLGDPDNTMAVAEQAQRAVADGSSPQEAQALELLAAALGEGTTPLPVTQEASGSAPQPSATPSRPALVVSPEVLPTDSPAAVVIVATDPPDAGSSPTTGTPASGAVRTGAVTATPLATRTPTPTPGAPFILEESTFICDRDLGQPLIQVLTQDSAGEPVPGVEVVVIWEGGEDHFFTGLKPELGLGYADFSMAPGTVYSLRLAAGGQPVPDLASAECETESGSRYWGSWLLVFTQP